VSDPLVLVLTGLLAVGVLGWAPWCIWHIAQRSPTRQRALTHVLGITAGTTLLGVVVPAVLKGALDPFPIWLVYAVPTVAAATALGWRWHALPPARGSHTGLAITSGVLLVVLVLASVAVT
jgi:predicted tellurium resistance membrane protein TerC